MEKNTLAAKVRSTKGKGAAGKLRRDGILPAVVYGGKDKKAISLTVNEREFREVLRSNHGSKNIIVDLKIEGKKKACSVILQEMQSHPYKDIIRHIDFLQIDMDEKRVVEVPVHLHGIPAGGANLETHLRSVEVECLPTNIPEEIVVDVSELEAGQSIHVSDLSLPEGSTLISDGSGLIAAAVEKTAEVVEGTEESEAAEGESTEEVSAAEETQE